MRIGFVGYSNLTSGIGIFGREFIDYLGVDSILSAPSYKGQEDWLGDNQFTSKIYPLSARDVERYFNQCQPDVVMFLETPFCDCLPEIAAQWGIKTVAIAMHEAMFWGHFKLRADLIVCPSYSAWEKACSAGAKAASLFLPIGLELFPYKKRTGHTFIQSLGYNEYNDRRQTAKIVAAFHRLEDPDARLILNTIGKWPPGTVIDDPRISYHRRETERPADIYAGGDIAMYPMAYEGYGRMVLEAMACGLPCLTVDGDPMNLFQHDPRFLCESEPTYHFTGPACADATYHSVTVDELEKKLRWLLTIDTAEYSRRARRQAEAQSWESKEIDYKTAWLNMLEDLVK